MHSVCRIGAYMGAIMSISLKFWEHGDIMGNVANALTVLAVATFTILGLVPDINPDIKHKLEVISGLWFVVLIVFVAPYRLWVLQKEKVKAFEEAARPKLTVSDPFDTVEPKGATGKAIREWRLKVTNESTSVIKNCYLKMKSFVNVSGHESDSIGIHFKLSTDQPLVIQSYEHRQTFDIPPGGHEIISIIGLNENQNMAMVIMLYAMHGAGGGAIRNGIPRNLFPHILVIQVCAENIVNPIEVTYKLHINHDGVLRMDRI